MWTGVATKVWSPEAWIQVLASGMMRRLWAGNRRSLGSRLSAGGQSTLGAAKWVIGASCTVLKCQRTP